MSKEFSNLTSDIKKDFAKNVRGYAPELSEENVGGAISKVLEDLGEYLKEKKSEVCKTTKEYKNKIKEYPFGFALAALAFGVIIGAVLKK